MTDLPKVEWRKPLNDKEYIEKVIEINKIYKELPFKKEDECKND
jgi:hypothetical protein